MHNERVVRGSPPGQNKIAVTRRARAPFPTFAEQLRGMVRDIVEQSPAARARTSAETPRRALPVPARGMRIGLLGGSFNPPHAAHRAMSVFAMKRLGLDRVWWLVTPGNPLKDTRALPPLPERVAAARAAAHHPRILVTDLEAQLGTRYTIDLVRLLPRRFPQVRFVWLMGADILGEFPRWRAWREIFHRVPIAVIDRGGTKLGVLASPAAQAFRAARLPAREARRLPACKPPAWVFLHGMKLTLSSSELRRRARAQSANEEIETAGGT